MILMKQSSTQMGRSVCILLISIMVCAPLSYAVSTEHRSDLPLVKTAEQYLPVEWGYKSRKQYDDPFNDVEVDVVFVHESGEQWRVPTFWAGGNEWRVRFAPPLSGNYRFHVESSDKDNPDLNGHEGMLRVESYAGANRLLIHGLLKVSANRRYFEYADGTPFLWLGDTWWDGLCRRISLDGFRSLAADREKKGFNVIQIVAGLDPDEEPFDERGKNEGGYAWDSGFTRINPAYFDAADQRIKALVDAGLSPAIVGSWGFYLPLMGADKAKKHWRNLVARYGAYPVVWVISGEVGATYWLSKNPEQDNEFQRQTTTELAQYVRSIDPYHRLITAHPSYPNSARHELLDESAVDFDMIQAGHWGWNSASNIVGYLSADYSKTPHMPVLIGEAVYEGHRQANWPDIERFAFWASIMNGAAGYTYGAGGIWQMNGTTVPHGPSPTGLTSSVTYENTPWNLAMHFPGSEQVGIGKDILAKYPWWRFEPHPEWVSPHGTAFQEPHAEWFNVAKRWDDDKGNYLLPYASGIPGDVRFIYQPSNGTSILGPFVTQLEKGLTYHAFYYDPINGERYDLGIVSRPELMKLSERSEHSLDDGEWLMCAGQQMSRIRKLRPIQPNCGVSKDIDQKDVWVSVQAHGDDEAGVLLRLHDAADSIVAVYSPKERAIWIHDRKQGEYGARLGVTCVPKIGPNIRLVAEAHGSFASLTLSDGEHMYRTSPVVVSNTESGRVGVWSEVLSCDHGLGGGGCRSAGTPMSKHQKQQFKHFVAYKIEGIAPGANPNPVVLDAWRAPNLPLMQDWILVLERSR